MPLKKTINFVIVVAKLTYFRLHMAVTKLIILFYSVNRTMLYYNQNIDKCGQQCRLK